MVFYLYFSSKFLLLYEYGFFLFTNIPCSFHTSLACSHVNYTDWKDFALKKKQLQTTDRTVMCLARVVYMCEWCVTGGFKAANKVKLARRLQEEQQRITQLPAAPPNETTIQFGLTTHRLFKTFTLFTHGIFAGFAFWHIIMVFTMIDRVGSATFLEYYQGIAQPVQSLYYLLFVLSTVSTFDR